MSNITHINPSVGVKKAISEFYSSLSLFFYEMNIEGQDAVDEFIVQFITAVYEKTKTKAGVYLATGFSRQTISNFFNEIRSRKDQTKENIFSSLITDLRDLSEYYDGGPIPIKGEKSYNWAFYRSGSQGTMITGKAMLESLEKRGVVERVDKAHIRLISTLPSSVDNTSEAITRLFSKKVQRYIKTLMHNYKAECNEDTLYDMSYFTKQIHPDNYKKATDELRELSRKYMSECKKLIDSYEEKGEFERKRIERLGQEVGVSTFLFVNPTNRRDET